MGGYYHDEETDIDTAYHFYIEGIEVDFNDSWCPGATISLYHRRQWVLGGRELLTMIDCPKVLHWTPPKLHLLWSGGVVEIEYWEDGYMRREELVTEEEADEKASRAAYDGRNEAHIAVTRTLFVGTSTVWLKVQRVQFYNSAMDLDVSICVEFANSEECTRFLHEDIRKLEHRFVDSDTDGDVAVIDDIMRALLPLSDDHDTAHDNAVKRSIPFSRFEDECPQPEMQLIRHRASNRGDDRPCFVTLHLSTNSFFRILRVDWSATTTPTTFPSPSGAFRSLNNVHLKFPFATSQDRDHNSQEDLTITISAGEISFSTGTCSISPGKGSTLSSKHCTVNINNYITKIMGDAFFGTINGGNNGGRNNTNTIGISSPVGSRSPRVAYPIPRRPTPPLRRQIESQAGVGRWVQPRPLRPRPY